MEVELESFVEEEEEEEDEDTIELGEVQDLGTVILETSLQQVFGAEDVEPGAHRRVQWPNYHRLP
jgi:hypothetical protein